MKINQMIRVKRKELALTQEQIAERLGVSAQAVHKWEKGIGCPDITLLPALARLLKTDLNTLMSFREDLSDKEIEQFVDDLDRLVREEGYSNAFQAAMDKIHEYPACEPLLYSAVLYLHDTLYLYGIEEPDRYEETFCSYYARLAESGEKEIRETSVNMLISHYRKKGDYARAEELIRSLPFSSVDREEQLAILYTQQEKYEEAVPLWEHRILHGVTEIQTALMNLLEIAGKEEKMEDAGYYADVYKRLSALSGIPAWIGESARLQLAVLQKNSKLCAEVLEIMLSSLREPWTAEQERLYGHLQWEGLNFLAERMCHILQQELETGGEFDFVENREALRQLCEELAKKGAAAGL